MWKIFFLKTLRNQDIKDGWKTKGKSNISVGCLLIWCFSDSVGGDWGAGDSEGHSRWFPLFSYSSSWSVTHIALWMVYYQLGERSHMNTGMSRGRKELCFDLHWSLSCTQVMPANTDSKTEAQGWLLFFNLSLIQTGKMKIWLSR